MLRPHSCMTETGPAGTKVTDAYQCLHCGGHRFVKPKERPEDLGGWCRNCDGPICPRCTGQPCVHFMKAIERMEARDAARRSYGF